MEYGLLGLIILVADIYAIVNIVSSSRSVLAKILWSLLVLVMPVIGFLVWLAAGPRGRAATV